MTEQLTPAQFRAAEGVTDWRVLALGASAYFRTGSFAKGVELVQEIGWLAEAAEHHPDVDLRQPRITVRLMTHDAEMGLCRHPYRPHTFMRLNMYIFSTTGDTVDACRCLR
jgi:pterin-4a-carbinolamine dehydratase